MLSESTMNYNFVCLWKYGTLLHTTRKKRLWVFKCRVMTFGPKREEVTQQRRLQEEDLDDLYSSPNTSGDQINKNEMSKACSMYRAQENIT